MEIKNKFAKDFREAGLELTIDSREPAEMVKEFMDIVGRDKVEISKLPTADYMVGRVGFERKKDDITNLGDVITKCTELSSQFPVAVLIVQKSLDQTIALANARGLHRNAVIGMVASLVARGVVPVFAGKKRNLTDLIIAISEKCNSDKDRTQIEPLRPQAKERDYAMRSMRGLGLGEEAAKKILKVYGTPKRSIEALYFIPYLDKKTKKYMGLGGIDAQVNKAIKSLESKYAGGGK